MTMISESWAYALDPAIRGTWSLAMSRRESRRAALFNVQPSTMATEEMFGVGALGVDAWDNYEKANAVSIAKIDQNYKKIFTHSEKLLKVHIERKLYDDNQFPQIFQMGTVVGDSMGLKREMDGASVFNNAFSASYTGADGVSLCNDSHPFSPVKTDKTQDNSYALSLTKTNVATVREAMMAFTDDNENKVGVTPDLLLVPPALEDEGLVIVRSLNDPDSANNAVNPQAGRFEVWPWHYLTDSNAWFMIDRTLMNQSLFWFDRVDPYLKYQGLIDEVVAEWIAYMRYSYGWTNWQWVAGSNPS